MIKFSLLTLFAVNATLLHADTPKKAWTDPAAATKEDPDFVVQGEYVAKIDSEVWGAQVVAEGNGKFAVVAYPGGLPGAGFTGKLEDRKRGKAERKPDGTVEFTVDNEVGTLKDGKIVGGAGSFEKVARKSPTLGAKAPEGAKVLFDGKSVEAFEGGKLDGELLCQGVTSKEKFGSGTLHVEFQIPYQPLDRGQGRGNSGCYLQGRYEVQMLDSFGLEGKNNECGGIYTIAAPKVNMAFPPLTWQTYDIDYTEAKFDAAGVKTTPAKITVKHNGVEILSETVLTHGTTAAPVPEGPGPGPLHLQNHGNPVRYRNIWWKPAAP